MNIEKNTNKLSSDKKKLRLKWLDLFRKNNFRYCILRGYDDAVSANDIEVDVLLHPEDLCRVRSVMLNEGYVLRSKFSNHPHFPFYLYDANGIVSIIDIVIEVRAGQNSKLWPVISTEQVLSRSIQKNNIPVISDADEFALTLLHEILDKGRIRNEWRHDVKSRLRHSDDSTKILSEILKSHRLASNLVELITQHEFEKAVTLSHQIQLHLFYKNIRKSIFIGVRSLLAKIWEKNWLKGPRVISFVGIDGSGKTSITSMLSKRAIENKKIINCKLGHGSERSYRYPITALICPVSAISKSEALKELSDTSSSRSSKIYISIALFKLWKLISRIAPLHRQISSILIPFLFWLEDTIEITILKRKSSRRDFIVTDRHLIDGIVHNVAYKGTSSRLYNLFYYNLAKTTQLMVFINCSGSTAYERKQEILPKTGDILNESYKYWLVNNYSKPQVWLDSSKPIEQLCKELDIIIQTLE